MSRSFTASDRSSLLRLASMMPKGSEERKTLLAGLRRVATTKWETNKREFSEGPWDPELSKYVGSGDAHWSTNRYLKDLQNNDGLFGEAAPFLSLIHI